MLHIPNHATVFDIYHWHARLSDSSLPLKCIGIFSGPLFIKRIEVISWSLEAARFGFRLFQLLLNLAGTSTAALPRCLSHFWATRSLSHPLSWLRDFMEFGGKTYYRLVNRGPDTKSMQQQARALCLIFGMWLALLCANAGLFGAEITIYASVKGEIKFSSIRMNFITMSL